MNQKVELARKRIGFSRERKEQSNLSKIIRY